MSTNGDGPDPNADYGELWASVHHYLFAQAAEPPSPAELAEAYGRMVDAHNLIYARYVAHQEEPPKVSGL